ncbi:MAG: hypothetical protein H5U08_11990, partial [Thermogutta sp.]|uniref:TadE/TadG family type IV pilus assembly protein n=1 Tax=Thermogutta sp. TaxID=1962930 RepID=UPI0019B14A11
MTELGWVPVDRQGMVPPGAPDWGERPAMRAIAERIRRLPRDDSGAMSVVAVFAVLLLTILLGMVMNVGRAVDHKVRLQNAADAVAYSGGVVIARGMNALAFSNHLLCDIFALTA